MRSTRSSTLAPALLASLVTIAACSPSHWSTPVSGLTGMMLSAWGSSSSDLWVVGGTGTDPTAETGEVIHFDGSVWRAITMVPSSVLWWVQGFPGGKEWIAGDNGVILRGDENGFTQVTTDAPAGVVFYGIWGASESEVWAVGGKLGVFSTMVKGDATGLHTVVGAPVVGSGGTWFKVWGSAANDVWFVGDSASLFHWDGSAFTKFDVTGAGIGANDRLTTVSGRSNGDIYAVGGLTLGGRALHYDGADWTPVQNLDLSRAGPLTGVSVAPTGDAFITGLDGTKLRFRAGVWYDDSLLDPLADLHAVYAFSVDDAFAAGGNFATLTQGIVAHWGGDLPTVMGTE